MQIKAADDVQPDIDALEALARRPDIDSRTRDRVEQEIRTIRSGAAGEREAAYEIEFEWGTSKNQATIHGLRIEVDGRVAQMDHVIINRVLDVWVCESKHFAEGVRINEHGEWEAFYQGRPYGMASPIDQVRRQTAVLADVFTKRLVPLPKRLGITVKPNINGLVIVSNQARISRPKGKVAAGIEGLDSVVKVERLIATIYRSFDQRSPAALLKVVTQAELEAFARRVAALHAPMKFDWAGRFGVPALTPEPANSHRRPSVRPACLNCGRNVSDAVIAFCRSRPGQFAGKVYCVDCQIPIVTAKA